MAVVAATGAASLRGGNVTKEDLQKGLPAITSIHALEKMISCLSTRATSIDDEDDDDEHDEHDIDGGGIANFRREEISPRPSKCA
jgi:hypothetical protein